MASQQQIIEKVEILDGSRAGARDKAAVRIEDVQELLQLAQVKTKTLTAAPTMNDFNSLLRDLNEISNRLNSVAMSIQRKIIR
ncbi:hypothetical protein GGQ73_003018 [Rhizobium skierniewicense]|uniref:Uncharacterized protein n=1 Tax=Rhizobium skierniewicense TaxID=984260 RepID=A0A7W6CCR4_9HYPH|nr:hypothetical protein [Rhizobium skierniewicense]MBB3947054.1 hypothetical protein [Rhizobium skierniewicense]